MSNFIRHIGKVGDRKAAVIFRQVPGETHMALIVYTETLNVNLHDALMQCLDSDIGQNSEHLADALNRSYTKDGKIVLQVLHAEGLLKKMQTNQVLMTPNSGTKIRLDELNKILDEMQQGESAVKRLQELDNSRGLQDPADIARRMRDNQAGNQPPVADVITDDSLAQQRIAQAQKMEREANGLLSEAKRLMDEAKALSPGLITAPTQAPALVVKRRGRPAKVKV